MRSPSSNDTEAQTNEEDYILSLLVAGDRSDDPGSDSGLAREVVKGDRVGSRLVQSDAAIDLRGDIHHGRSLSILSVQVLVPRECPFLQLRLGFAEELGDALGRAAILGDGRSELFVWHTAIERLGAVDGGVDFETDIELLTRQEVLLVRRQDTAQSRTGSESLEGLGRDRRDRGREDHGEVLAQHCSLLCS